MGFKGFKGFKGFALVLALGLCATGCGYALAGRGSFLPDYIQTIGVPQLLNRSTFPVEQLLTDKIRTEFIGRGRFRVIPETPGADAVLSGEITGIAVQPVGFNEQQFGSRYLFTITMKIDFTDARTNDVLWSNPALTFREEYDLTTRGNTAIEGAAFVDQERSSLDRIGNDISRTVVTAILEAF